MGMAATAVFVVSVSMAAQQACPNGARIDGTITDPSGARIAKAEVEAANGAKTQTDADGHYVLPCAPATTTITVRAEGFATRTAGTNARRGQAAHLDLQLALASVQTDVQVSADASGVDSDNDAGGTTLSTAEVQRLPDDPDDLVRQLQVLALAAGGDASSAIITVDGFRNSSALPPKGSIAAVRVNPDLFSAEYQWPPWGGGVIEIVTKPGSSGIHGAGFFSDSDAAFNARDPLSIVATPAEKQRYGFELSGPFVSQKSGYSVALEKRDINEFNVVDATTLGAGGEPSPFRQTIAAPQRLWIGSVRGDWQMTPRDAGTVSFAANVNNLDNQGVGGLVLPEAGYSSLASEYDLRLSNVFTASASLLHETRIGYTWKHAEEAPLSTAPSVMVAGYFSGGGAASQALNSRERDLEIDDDAMLTRGKHTLKLGAQSLGYFFDNHDPDTFNGAFVFGGGSAPVLDARNDPTGQTTTISGIEQYRRALNNLPGGSPTTYRVTTGTPRVTFSQWLLGMFVGDTVKLLPQVTLDAGLRYEFETTPGSYANFAPRLGVAWAIDKKQTWVIHLRGGLFPRSAGEFSDLMQVKRLNGALQRSVEVYAPDFRDPLGPAAGSIRVSTVGRFPHSFGMMDTFIAYLNIEHQFTRQWTARVNLFSGQDWDSLRIRNINAPMVASSVGVAPNPPAALKAPRPIAPDENILQYQNSGHLMGNLVSFNLDQHNYKRFGLSLRYAHLSFKSDVVDGGLNSPQSSYSEKGESSRVEWSRDHEFSLTGNLNLPYKLEAAAQADGNSGTRYTITTGTDNNGDGNFNDRPSYAAQPGPGVFATRFGLLTTNTVNGNMPRNAGIMPGPIHLDVNLSRTFTVDPKDKDHPHTFTLNARSANLLNHTNVTAVNPVLSSSAVGEPVAAEAARRLELGLRFAF